MEELSEAIGIKLFIELKEEISKKNEGFLNEVANDFANFRKKLEAVLIPTNNGFRVPKPPKQKTVRKVESTPPRLNYARPEIPRFSPSLSAISSISAGSVTAVKRSIRIAKKAGTESHQNPLKTLRSQREQTEDFTPPHQTKYSRRVTRAAAVQNDVDTVDSVNYGAMAGIFVTSTPTTDNDKTYQVMKNNKDDKTYQVLENIENTASKIPVSVTPKTPKSRALYSMTKTESVKKRVEAFEQHYKVVQTSGTGGSTVVKSKELSESVKKLAEKMEILEDGNKPAGSRMTRNMSKINRDTKQCREDAVKKGNKVRPLAATENIISSASTAKTHKIPKSPENGTNLKSLHDDNEAIKKKEELIKAAAEDLKRKQEAKGRKVVAAREAAEKEKQELALKVEREKEEKFKQLLKEKEERLKEAQLKKRQATAQKAAKAEERRKLEEAARLARLREIEEEKNRIFASKMREQQKQEELKAQELAERQKEKAKPTGTKFSKLLSSQEDDIQDYDINNVETDDSTDEESKPKKLIPRWAEFESRNKAAIIQTYIKPQLIRRWFYNKEDKVPDLRGIFEETHPRRPRTSSACWNSRICFDTTTGSMFNV